jgi:hypothetical protein
MNPGRRASIERCLDDCVVCARTCLETLQSCLERNRTDGDESPCEPYHVSNLSNCARLCETTSHFLLSGSAHAFLVCELAADICTDLAEECEEIGESHDACAAACRRCAESCGAVAAEARARFSRSETRTPSRPEESSASRAPEDSL